MSRLALVVTTSITSTLITLAFQHFMVIKPLMDMLDACRTGG